MVGLGGAASPERGVADMDVRHTIISVRKMRHSVESRSETSSELRAFKYD